MIRYFLFVLSVVFIGCNDENLIFEIGGKYVDENMHIFFSDTLSVNSFTVKLDSLPTSGYKTILVGHYQDSVFGNIYSRSFIDVKKPINMKTIPIGAEFDSIQLILLYNGYSFGDTSKSQIITIHRLEDRLKTGEDGKLYNTSSFGYEPVPYGQVTFKPLPSGKDSVKIRLLDSFGLQLFEAFKNKSDIVSDQASFQNFLKGFVINYDDSNKAVMGFHAADTVTLMRLYYHYVDIEEVHEKIDFALYDGRVQFNQIAASDASFELPIDQRDKIIALQTDSTTFVQAGTGIYTRIEIPYLKKILETTENIEILRADIVMEPKRDSYTKNSLPLYISAYITDNSNRILYPLLNVFDRSTIQIADLYIDELFHEDTRYRFNITNFINAKLKEQTDDVPALLISISPNEVYYTVDRLILGSRWHIDNDVALELYFMSYE